MDRAGTCRAHQFVVAALVFLVIGLLCALIGRILLIGAAFGVNVWWGLGVFLPFGPLLFRLNYPDSGRSSVGFRLATMPCLFLYFVLGPGLTSSAFYRPKTKHVRPPAEIPPQYAMESSGHPAKSKGNGPKVELAPNPAECRAANAKEFDRLAKWSEALRLKKRDLLHSDVAGNRTYDLELKQYNEALAKAHAQKEVLFGAKEIAPAGRPRPTPVDQ